MPLFSFKVREYYFLAFSGEKNVRIVAPHESTRVNILNHTINYPYLCLALGRTKFFRSM